MAAELSMDNRCSGERFSEQFHPLKNSPLCLMFRSKEKRKKTGNLFSGGVSVSRLARPQVHCAQPLVAHSGCSDALVKKIKSHK